MRADRLAERRGLDDAAETTLAIDVGATRTRLAIVRDGAIADRVTRLTADLADGDDGVVSRLMRAARELAEDAPGARPRAIGVGAAASVGHDGSILERRDFGIPAGPRLRDALDGLGLPVAIDNDANLAALAEVRLGVAGDGAAVAVLTMGTNIGLGLVLDGRLCRGARGAAGEAGLMLVAARDAGGASGGRRTVDAGPLGRAVSRAPAGYAFVEELVGGGGLRAAAECATRAAPGGSTPRVLAAESQADPRLAPLAGRAIEGWALLIANLTVVLDLDLVVLTGAVANDAAHLLDRLRTRVAELVAVPPAVRLGSLGPDAELLGADLVARAALASRAQSDAEAGFPARPRGGDR